MIKKLLVFFISTLFIFSAVSYAETPAGETIEMDIDTPHPYPQYWTTTVHQGGAGWLRLHFTNLKLNDEDIVVLKDIYGNEVERFSGADVMDAADSRFAVTEEGNGRVSFWGPLVDGPETTIELSRASDTKKGYGFSIDQAGVGFEYLENIDDEMPSTSDLCGFDDGTSIACAPSWCQATCRSVGRMSYQKGTSWYVCTGFLVSSCSSHFLTNEHCITSQTEVNTLNVRFNYRLSTCGGSASSYSTYYGASFITDDPTNDYCLLTLGGSPQSSYGYLTLLSREPINGEKIYICQHPMGRRMEISFCTISATNMRSGLDFGYNCDIEGGSSGSPVLTDEYDYDKVIGLHHLSGCPRSAVEINQIRAAILSYICE